MTRFLQQQLAEGQALAAASDLVGVFPVAGFGPEIDRYLVEFRCAGLAREQGNVVVRHCWAFGIVFPPDYLRQPPDTAMILTYFGPEPEPWHPNLRPPFVCMHLPPGASLVEITLGLFDLITWNVYSTADEGLNHAASQWARRPENQARLPLERRPLKRRPEAPAISAPSVPVLS